MSKGKLAFSIAELTTKAPAYVAIAYTGCIVG